MLNLTTWRAVTAATLLIAAPAFGALQVHLTFDENVGPTSFNGGTTGETNDATLNSGNSRVVGNIGGAIDFNNTSSTSSVAGTNPLPGDTLRTVSFWVNSTEVSGLNNYLSFGTNNNPAGGTSDPGTKFDIGIDANTGHLEVGVGGGRLDSSLPLITTPTLTDGMWHLATVVMPDILDDDPAAADMSDIDIYIDGVFSYDGSSNNSADRTISTDPNGSLFIGRAANGPEFDNPNGAMDDVAVWDNPLTPDEIKGLYDVGSQLSVNAGIYDQVLSLHDGGSGTLFAGDFAWTYATGLASAAGITGSSLVLDDAANTGVTFNALVPGDVNRNGVVDTIDLGIIRSNFNNPSVTRDDGDLTGDGVVDFTDFRVWKDAAGAPATSLSFLSVPEPTSLLLIAGFSIALASRRRALCAMLIVGLAVSFANVDKANAQATNVYYNSATGDYNTNGNWDTGFVPEAALDEIAIIGSTSTEGVTVGAAPDATVTISSTPFNPAGLKLGDGAGSVGRLTVQSGNNLTIPGTITVTSGLQIGNGLEGGSRGFLTIESGASVSSNVINQNGPAETDGSDEVDWSTVSMSGTASLTSTTGVINFNRNISVSGPDVTISSAGDIGIGGRGRYHAEITGATHSVMTAAGNVQLNGILIPTFSGTAVPVEGASWDLFDSATVGNNFSEIRVPNRVPGQGYVIETRPGGNGVITSLAIRSTLVLEVNRDTGVVDITQPFGSPVSMNGYSIESASGNLGVGSWNSLDDQGIDGDWTEANPSSTALNELKPTSATVVSGSGFSLGQAYTPDFSTFGQAIQEDLVFEYFDTTTGQVVTGEVIYSGTKINDLVLIVDPSTGEAQLRNTSNASVAIDGYQISSTSGALSTAGWNSLEDQTSDWLEATMTQFSLSELLPEGVETLLGNSGYNLGTIFNTSGEQDIILEYLAEGANVLQEGSVLYSALPDLALLGDYNDDGTVDAADYTVWRDSLGSSGLGLAADGNNDGTVDSLDYDLWVANYGSSSSSSSAAAASVPEPSTGLLGLIAACLSFLLRKPRRSTVVSMVVCNKVNVNRNRMVNYFPAIAACFLLFGMTSVSQSQTIVFDHNFDNAPSTGSAVTSIADLGAPTVGSFAFSGPAIGGIGGTNTALAVGHNGNTNIANMSEPADNTVVYSGVFPETQVADAGTGDRLFLDFSSPADITSTSFSTDISFSLGMFGNSNTGSFKYTFVRGLDSSDNEVFELLFVNGSAGGTREFYARGASDDSTELTASNTGTPDGQLLAEGFGSFNSTNVANGGPNSAYLVDISLSSSMVTYDISATNGSGTTTAVNGSALPINSAATSISRLEFSTIWNDAVNGQNSGYWLDNAFAIVTPLGPFPDGDVDLDGNVDIDDFNIIASNFKSNASSRSQGDLNEDGFVDFADFQIWTDNSSPSTALAATSIPEPSAALLLLLASSLAMNKRRS